MIGEGSYKYYQALIVERVYNAIHCINCYVVDKCWQIKPHDPLNPQDSVINTFKHWGQTSERRVRLASSLVRLLTEVALVQLFHFEPFSLFRYSKLKLLMSTLLVM